MSLMRKLPRYATDPQVHTAIDAFGERLFSSSPEQQTAILDKYLGRDKWLEWVFDRFADDILDAMEEEAAIDEAEAQQ